MNVTVPAGVRANGSYYAHVFVTKAGHSPDPASDAYDRLATIYRRAGEEAPLPWRALPHNDASPSCGPL